VILRYIVVGATATAWPEALARLLLVWITFWGASVVFREGGHFNIDLVVNRLGQRLRSLTKILADLIVTALLLVVLKEAVVTTAAQMHYLTALMLSYLTIKAIKGFRRRFQER
jgi:TRAP-type C4-dicarboxylate transport system permease small subunit